MRRLSSGNVSFAVDADIGFSAKVAVAVGNYFGGGKVDKGDGISALGVNVSKGAMFRWKEAQ